MTYHRRPQQPCEHCGATFSSPVRTKRFCSDQCRMQAWHQAHKFQSILPRLCQACGQQFTPTRCRTTAYCSERCYQRARYRQARGLPVGPEKRQCWWCDGPFTAVRYTHQRCCSDACRRIVASLSGHRSKYGISPEQYRDLWRAQGGRCAICRRPEGKGGRIQLLCVDHAHGDGRVRGLLCDNCNRAIGLLGDSPDVLDRAATYLRQPVGPVPFMAAHGAPLG